MWAWATACSYGKPAVQAAAAELFVSLDQLQDKELFAQERRRQRGHEGRRSQQ